MYVPLKVYVSSQNTFVSDQLLTSSGIMVGMHHSLFNSNTVYAIYT